MVWKSRAASHANDWYEGRGNVLSGQLENFILNAGPQLFPPARAVIVP